MANAIPISGADVPRSARKSEPVAAPAATSKEAELNRNLAARFLTAGILIPVVMGFIFMGKYWFATFISFIAIVATRESTAMVLPKKDPLRLLAVAAAAVMPYLFVVSRVSGQHLHGLWVGLVIAALALRMFRNIPVDSAVRDVTAVVFAAIYGSLIGYTVALRELQPTRGWDQSGWVVLACVLSWFNDTGAYFAGRFLGKHKLFPRISPKKTWEGFAGGMVASVAGAFLVRYLFHMEAMLHVGDCLALGVIAGILGPIGDLAESMLKRSSGVKDSGHILPGHGGMLDRIDALMFNGPMLLGYYYLFVEPRLMG